MQLERRDKDVGQEDKREQRREDVHAIAGVVAQAVQGVAGEDQGDEGEDELDDAQDAEPGWLVGDVWVRRPVAVGVQVLVEVVGHFGGVVRLRCGLVWVVQKLSLGGVIAIGVRYSKMIALGELLMKSEMVRKTQLVSKKVTRRIYRRIRLSLDR